VMRLNKQSMDKLYDLMIMMFKYQMLSCTAPDMLYAVTARHLFSVQVLKRKKRKKKKRKEYIYMHMCECILYLYLHIAVF
jgi:membrane protein CcdC involved in cytochrome C biogenesis